MNGIKKYAFSYIDYLLFLAITVLVLFILMVIQVQQQAKGNRVDKAEYIIEMEWEDGSKNDIDLWVANPTGQISMFLQKDIGLLTLDRDDLGRENNTVVDIHGNVVENKMRREVTSIRAVMPGKYVVNGLLYSSRENAVTKVTVKVRRLNPYVEIHESSHVFTKLKEEHTFVQFELNQAGDVIWSDKTSQAGLYGKLALK